MLGVSLLLATWQACLAVLGIARLRAPRREIEFPVAKRPLRNPPFCLAAIVRRLTPYWYKVRNL